MIDVHLHFNEPGRTDWEGAATGSRALAAGGGTLFFDMPLNSTPCTVNARPSTRSAPHWSGPPSPISRCGAASSPAIVGELAELAERGVIGFKAFLSDSGLPEFPRSDDLTLYEGMREAARLGLPVAVHAESEEITSRLTRRAREAGRLTARDYLDSRPVIAEVEAIQRAALLAREAGCKLHIVHISSGRGVAAALEARARGTDISIETCAALPVLHRGGHGAPRRGRQMRAAAARLATSSEALWAHVLDGSVDIVASRPFPRPARDEDAATISSRIWGGIAGVQSTLAVLLEAGHLSAPAWSGSRN